MWGSYSGYPPASTSQPSVRMCCCFSLRNIYFITTKCATIVRAMSNFSHKRASSHRLQMRLLKTGLAAVADQSYRRRCQRPSRSWGVGCWKGRNSLLSAAILAQGWVHDRRRLLSAGVIVPSRAFRSRLRTVRIRIHNPFNLSWTSLHCLSTLQVSFTLLRNCHVYTRSREGYSTRSEGEED